MRAKEEYETSFKEDSGAAVHVELPHLENFLDKEAFINSTYP